MSRDLPTELAEAIDQQVVHPFLAVHIDLPDPVYVWTGLGTLQFESAEWLGAGAIGAVDTVSEGTDGSATGIKVSLLQVPSEFRDDIADQATKGALFELYVGSLNETYQVVEAVKKIWVGRLDTYEIVDSGSSLSVQITAESRMRDQRRPSIVRMTDEYQQRRFPGDKFFEFAARMQEVQVVWGQATQSPSFGGGGGGAGAREPFNPFVRPF